MSNGNFKEKDSLLGGADYTKMVFTSTRELIEPIRYLENFKGKGLEASHSSTEYEHIEHVLTLEQFDNLESMPAKIKHNIHAVISYKLSNIHINTCSVHFNVIGIFI